MAEDLKPSNVDFGVVIAFVAPGFVAFLAVSYHLPTAGAWMAAASHTEQSVGVFLFVLLASLSLGLIVSGVRSLVVDRLLRCHLLGHLAVPNLNLNWSRVDDKNLILLLTIRDNHYRYYQFYANTLVASVLWTLARPLSAAPALPPLFWSLVAGVLVALLLSAREAWLRYVTAVDQVLKPQRGESHE
jgi:hypothetical protein